MTHLSDHLSASFRSQRAQMPDSSSQDNKSSSLENPFTEQPSMANIMNEMSQLKDVVATLTNSINTMQSIIVLMKAKLEELESSAPLTPSSASSPEAGNTELFTPPIDQGEAKGQEVYPSNDQERELAEKPVVPDRVYNTVSHKAPTLKPEEIGFFDPEYQDGTDGPITYLGKYVLYRDVYFFVARIKDVIARHGEDIEDVIPDCLRGSARAWYHIECSEDFGSSNKWCLALLDRFKMRWSVALDIFSHQSYGPQDLHHQSPRSFAQQVLYYARAAEIKSEFRKMNVIWNGLHHSLRTDIPEPDPDCPLSTWLAYIDEKAPIWLERVSDPEDPYYQHLQQRPQCQAEQPPRQYRAQPEYHQPYPPEQHRRTTSRSMRANAPPGQRGGFPESDIAKKQHLALKTPIKSGKTNAYFVHVTDEDDDFGEERDWQDHKQVDWQEGWRTWPSRS